MRDTSYSILVDEGTIQKGDDEREAENGDLENDDQSH
jgi:hypothetical protein